MARAYQKLTDSPHDGRELTEAEEELLVLLKTRGVPSLCDAIGREINYVWAVASGFKTLAAVGHFYFACGSQTFGYNPAYDFFAANGMQLALFTLHKFIHNEHVLVPALDCVRIYTKLHVNGALEFLAVPDAKEILMKCVRFHDNKHDVISAACQALGSLVLNDLVKETVSSPELTLELLGLLKRYHASQAICRGALVPLGFLVTDASITATFVDGNGVALTMTAMKQFLHDPELVWHAIGVLNGLHAKTLDVRLIYAIFNFTGVARIVEALASHLDTEEIVVEGFQLLAKLAALREAYATINHAKVLDLAYVALFAYNGPQHRHTRMEIQKTMYPFQKCALYDPKELAYREQASRVDLVLYAGFVVCFLLMSTLSMYDHSTSDLVVAVENALVHKPWPSSDGHPGGPSSSVGRTLRDVHTIQDVWSYLLHPLHDTLFQNQWYNGDRFEADNVDSQLGIVDRAHILLGGLQLRVLRVQNETSSSYAPPYSQVVELKETIDRTPHFVDQWSEDDSSNTFHGRLASYPMTRGYRQFIPRLSNASVASSDSCSPYCQLTKLQRGRWLDASVRALFVEFNLYNPVVDVHCTSTILFEFPITGGAALVSTRFAPIHLDLYPGIFVFTSPRFYVELAVLAGVVWFAAKQIGKMLRYRAFYFVVVPHVVDFTIVALWIAVISSHVQFLVTASSHALRVRVASASEDASKLSFVDLDAIVHLVQTKRVLMAWTALLMGWRLLRFAKCLKPLAHVLVKFEHAEKMLQTFLVVLALYVLGFAHASTLLFPSSSSSSSSVASGFRDFSVSIATMCRDLLRHSHHPKGDNLSGNASILFRVLFQLATTFVVLNMVVVILRERFDSMRGTKSSGADGGVKGGDEGDSLLELAKKQLEAKGMNVMYEPSLPKKLQMAATRGLEKLQHATHELFAIADTPVELSNLKKVWGLRSADESDDDGNASREEANEARAQRLLQSVEDLDTALNHELAYFALRIEDAMQQLQQFQTLLQRQIDEKKQFEEKSRPPQVAVTEDAVDVMQQQQNAIAHPPPPVADDDEPPVAAQEHVTTVFASPEQTQHLHHTSALPEPLMPAGIVLLPGAIATNDQEDDETSSSAKKDE